VVLPIMLGVGIPSFMCLVIAFLLVGPLSDTDPAQIGNSPLVMGVAMVSAHGFAACTAPPPTSGSRATRSPTASGRSFAVVMAAFLGSEVDGQALLRPLRDLGPAWDSFAMVHRSYSAT